MAPKTGSKAAVSAKVGAPIRIDGHTYQITAIDDRGVFEFARQKGDGPGSTTHRRGLGVVADIRDSGEGWLYLPNRVTPKLGAMVDAAVADSVIPANQAAEVAAMIRSHPAYFDRDDTAVAAAEEAYGVTLWES